MGSLVTVAVLQLVVYPYLAKTNSAEAYGIILTLMGIVNIIIVSLGNSLNNIRLVQNTEYKNRNIEGDFNLILLGSLIIGSLVLYTINHSMDIDEATTILLVLTLILGICKSYFSVTFRLQLKFTLQMFGSFITAAGFIIGLIAFFYTKYWPLAFLIAEIFSLGFIYLNSDILKESIKVTILFKQTFRKYLALISASMIGNLIVYLDRLLLLPTLGGEAVATYTVAAFFGKSLSLVLVPIAGVLLGYYAQQNFVMNRRLFWKINLAVIVFSILFFIFSLVMAEWFTGLLYPTLIDKAAQYIILANIAAIIGATGSITQPAVLKFSPIKWQIVIQIIHGFIYFIGGLILINYWQILGFCVAAIIANLVRLIILYWVGNHSIKI